MMGLNSDGKVQTCVFRDEDFSPKGTDDIDAGAAACGAASAAAPLFLIVLQRTLQRQKPKQQVQQQV